MHYILHSRVVFVTLLLVVALASFIPGSTIVFRIPHSLSGVEVRV